MTENSVAWQRVFERLNLQAVLSEHGIGYVTADQLKEHGAREPRLMAKMDTLRDRPDIFDQNEVNIFPVKNGKYVLFKDPENKTYFKFGEALDNAPVQNYVSPVPLSNFDTFPGSKQFSESQAIDFAFVASLLKTFLGDSNIQLTIRGRLYSDQFAFRAPQSEQDIEVNKVQIEVDSGYEGENSIFLIEAKVGKRDDFNIRQIYYPFLNWSAKSRKKIVPVFLTFTNGQFFLTEFAFTKLFGELKIVRSECYSINESPFAEIDWRRLLRESPFEAEETPFPQADDLDKVVDLIRLAESGLNDKFQFAEFFEFDARSEVLGYARERNEFDAAGSAHIGEVQGVAEDAISRPRKFGGGD